MNVIDDILRREGSAYTNRPEDRGGPTKWGVTLKTLDVFYQLKKGRDATIEDVKNLSESEAREVYQYLYIEAPGFDKIASPLLRHFLIDSGVQHGAHKVLHGNDRVARWLQAAVNVKIDGVIGPQTLTAVNSYPWREVYREVFRTRMKFYGRIITDNPSQSVFAAGWMNRLSEFLI